MFNWIDTEVGIAHGIVDVHVTFNGEDIYNAPVYLFTASGSYLGRYEYTDTYGHASFFVPAQSYKFRVDYDGIQYWSDVISVIAHEETDVEMPLEQLALNKTNDPNPIRYDGEPPVFEPEGIKVASIGSLAGIISQAVVANTTPPKVYYYLNDHLGTPQLMTNENNVVVWEAKYRPFGEAVVHPYSTVENNLRLPGQYFDQETRLHYNYHRYYDPRTGRYLTPDPLRFLQIQIVGHSFINRNLSNLVNFTNEIEIKQIFLRNILHYFIFNNIETSNLFTYVLNNPINYTDPMGLQGSQWDLVSSYKALHGAKPPQRRQLTDEDKKALRALVDAFFDNLSIIVPGPVTGVLQTEEQIIKYIQEIYGIFDLKDLEACEGK